MLNNSLLLSNKNNLKKYSFTKRNINVIARPKVLIRDSRNCKFSSKATEWGWGPLFLKQSGYARSLKTAFLTVTPLRLGLTTVNIHNKGLIGCKIESQHKINKQPLKRFSVGNNYFGKTQNGEELHKKEAKHTKIEGKDKKIYWNYTFDKGRLKNYVSWFLRQFGEYKTIKLLEQLKYIGFDYATKAGISLGIDDLKIPATKAILFVEAEKNTKVTVDQFNRGEITGVEKFQRLIETWHRTSEVLKQEVIDNFEHTNILNPVYMMAFSGARGNISQVRQLVGMRGLMADPQGQLIDYPIRSNFREGLTLTEYIISCYGARKGIVDTALRTANAGYLTRRLVDVAQHVMISLFDCGTQRGIYLSDMKEGKKIIYSLQTRLIGRVLARDIVVYQPTLTELKPHQIIRESKSALTVTSVQLGLSYFLAKSNAPENKPENKKDRLKLNNNSSPAAGNKHPSNLKYIYNRNQEISSELAFDLGKISNKIFVRSPLTCETKKLVCQLCYGWSLAQGNLVSIGEAIGVIAGQSIGEPGTQLTMRTFHTGGAFSGDISDQVRAPFEGFVIYEFPIPGLLIRNPDGKICFLTKGEGYIYICRESKLFSIAEKNEFERKGAKKYKIPSYTILYARNGEHVFENQILAQINSLNFVDGKIQQNIRDDAEFTIKTQLEGEIYTETITACEKYIGPKLSFEERELANIGLHFKNPEFINKRDVILESWNWGFSWVLSGKIYQLPVSTFLIPKLGDFVSKDSILSQMQWFIPPNGSQVFGLQQKSFSNIKPYLPLFKNRVFTAKGLSEPLSVDLKNRNERQIKNSSYKINGYKIKKLIQLGKKDYVRVPNKDSDFRLGSGISQKNIQKNIRCCSPIPLGIKPLVKGKQKTIYKEKKPIIQQILLSFPTLWVGYKKLGYFFAQLPFFSQPNHDFSQSKGISSVVNSKRQSYIINKDLLFSPGGISSKLADNTNSPSLFPAMVRQEHQYKNNKVFSKKPIFNFNSISHGFNRGIKNFKIESSDKIEFNPNPAFRLVRKAPFLPKDKSLLYKEQHIHFLGDSLCNHEFGLTSLNPNPVKIEKIQNRSLSDQKTSLDYLESIGNKKIIPLNSNNIKNQKGLSKSKNVVLQTGNKPKKVKLLKDKTEKILQFYPYFKNFKTSSLIFIENVPLTLKENLKITNISESLSLHSDSLNNISSYLTAVEPIKYPINLSGSKRKNQDASHYNKKYLRFAEVKYAYKPKEKQEEKQERHPTLQKTRVGDPCLFSAAKKGLLGFRDIKGKLNIDNNKDIINKKKNILSNISNFSLFLKYTKNSFYKNIPNFKTNSTRNFIQQSSLFFIVPQNLYKVWLPFNYTLGTKNKNKKETIFSKNQNFSFVNLQGFEKNQKISHLKETRPLVGTLDFSGFRGLVAKDKFTTDSSLENKIVANISNNVKDKKNSHSRKNYVLKKNSYIFDISSKKHLKLEILKVNKKNIYNDVAFKSQNKRFKHSSRVFKKPYEFKRKNYNSIGVNFDDLKIIESKDKNITELNWIKNSISKNKPVPFFIQRSTQKTSSSQSSSNIPYGLRENQKIPFSFPSLFSEARNIKPFLFSGAKEGKKETMDFLNISPYKTAFPLNSFYKMSPNNPYLVKGGLAFSKFNSNYKILLTKKHYKNMKSYFKLKTIKTAVFLNSFDDMSPKNTSLGLINKQRPLPIKDRSQPNNKLEQILQIKKKFQKKQKLNLNNLYTKNIKTANRELLYTKKNPFFKLPIYSFYNSNISTLTQNKSVSTETSLYNNKELRPHLIIREGKKTITRFYPVKIKKSSMFLSFNKVKEDMDDNYKTKNINFDKTKNSYLTFSRKFLLKELLNPQKLIKKKKNKYKTFINTLKTGWIYKEIKNLNKENPIKLVFPGKVININKFPILKNKERPKKGQKVAPLTNDYFNSIKTKKTTKKYTKKTYIINNRKNMESYYLENNKQKSTYFNNLVFDSHITFFETFLFQQRTDLERISIFKSSKFSWIKNKNNPWLTSAVLRKRDFNKKSYEWPPTLDKQDNKNGTLFSQAKEDKENCFCWVKNKNARFKPDFSLIEPSFVALEDHLILQNFIKDYQVLKKNNHTKKDYKNKKGFDSFGFVAFFNSFLFESLRLFYLANLNNTTFFNKKNLQPKNKKFKYFEYKEQESLPFPYLFILDKYKKNIHKLTFNKFKQNRLQNQGVLNPLKEKLREAISYKIFTNVLVQNPINGLDLKKKLINQQNNSSKGIGYNAFSLKIPNKLVFFFYCPTKTKYTESQNQQKIKKLKSSLRCKNKKGYRKSYSKGKSFAFRNLFFTNYPFFYPSSYSLLLKKEFGQSGLLNKQKITINKTPKIPNKDFEIVSKLSAHNFLQQTFSLLYQRAETSIEPGYQPNNKTTGLTGFTSLSLKPVKVDKIIKNQTKTEIPNKDIIKTKPFFRYAYSPLLLDNPNTLLDRGVKYSTVKVAKNLLHVDYKNLVQELGKLEQKLESSLPFIYSYKKNPFCVLTLQLRISNNLGFYTKPKYYFNSIKNISLLIALAYKNSTAYKTYGGQTSKEKLQESGPFINNNKTLQQYSAKIKKGIVTSLSLNSQKNILKGEENFRNKQDIALLYKKEANIKSITDLYLSLEQPFFAYCLTATLTGLRLKNGVYSKQVYNRNINKNLSYTTNQSAKDHFLPRYNITKLRDYIVTIEKQKTKTYSKIAGLKTANYTRRFLNRSSIAIRTKFFILANKKMALSKPVAKTSFYSPFEGEIVKISQFNRFQKNFLFSKLAETVENFYKKYNMYEPYSVTKNKNSSFIKEYKAEPLRDNGCLFLTKKDCLSFYCYAAKIKEVSLLRTEERPIVLPSPKNIQGLNFVKIDKKKISKNKNFNKTNVGDFIFPGQSLFIKNKKEIILKDSNKTTLPYKEQYNSIEHASLSPNAVKVDFLKNENSRGSYAAGQLIHIGLIKSGLNIFDGLFHFSSFLEYFEYTLDGFTSGKVDSNSLKLGAIPFINKDRNIKIKNQDINNNLFRILVPFIKKKNHQKINKSLHRKLKNNNIKTSFCLNSFYKMDPKGTSLVLKSLKKKSLYFSKSEDRDTRFIKNRVLNSIPGSFFKREIKMGIHLTNKKHSYTDYWAGRLNFRVPIIKSEGYKKKEERSMVLPSPKNIEGLNPVNMNSLEVEMVKTTALLSKLSFGSRLFLANSANNIFASWVFTIRKAQPLLISEKSILHAVDGDFIKERIPVVTLAYQKLKTGDIIQGIPKVEQFFEARTTKRGRLFLDNISNILKGLFLYYKKNLYGRLSLTNLNKYKENSKLKKPKKNIMELGNKRNRNNALFGEPKTLGKNIKKNIKSNLGFILDEGIPNQIKNISITPFGLYKDGQKPISDIPERIIPRAASFRSNIKKAQVVEPVITISKRTRKSKTRAKALSSAKLKSQSTLRSLKLREVQPGGISQEKNQTNVTFSLKDVVRQSIYKIQQITVDGVLRVYKSQGVTISDKHLEIIVKQMTSKVKIIQGGQTGFFPGELVNLDFVEHVNNLLMRGQAQYEPHILGITKASLEVESFISAASFQQTTRILSFAALSKKKDFLKGLKENVIIGNLIPAGTGYFNKFIKK